MPEALAEISLQSFAALQDGATANATINETAGYIQGINTSFIEEYLNANINVTELQNITTDFFIPDEVMPPEEVYLPFSMQFDYNRSYEYTTLPSALKWKVNLTISSSNSSVLFYENNLTEIAGLPFAIDFTPTTANDSQNMQNSSIPAYEINVTPQIWLNSTHVNGTPVPWGSEVSVSFSMQMINTTYMTKWLYAGEKSAIVIDAPKTEFAAYNKTFERVQALQNTSQNETLAREGLYLIGSHFFLSSDYHTDQQSEGFGIRWARTSPAVLFVTKENLVESFNGTPISVSNGGTSNDLKYDSIVSSDDSSLAASFNLLRGFAVSGFEGTSLENFYDNVTGISAVYLLGKAIDGNVSVYIISNDTIDRLDNLSISQYDKEIIRELLQKSPTLFAMIPESPSQTGNWSGIGYAIIDSITGETKYLISGGLSGGGTSEITDNITPCSRFLGKAYMLGVFAAMFAAGLAMYCASTLFVPLICRTLIIEEPVNYLIDPIPGAADVPGWLLQLGYEEYCGENGY